MSSHIKIHQHLCLGQFLDLQLFTIQYIRWWTVLLVSYWAVFIICLDSHSDGTHSLQRIHWWASDVMLNFNFKWKNISTHLWIVWGWVVQQLFIFGWTIPLKIISYSLDIRLQVKDLCKSYTIIMLFACMFRVRGIRSTNRWLTVWKWYVYNRILLLYLTEVISYCLNALHNYQEQFLSSCIRGNGSWWISNRVSRWKTLKFTYSLPNVFC